MAIYLDLIPKDLSYLIFYKINNADKLFYNGLYEEILSDINFWEGNIKYSTRGLNLDLIPRWLYNYKGLPVEIAIQNFLVLRGAYRAGKYHISNDRYKIFLKPGTVNNPKAYVHVDKIIESGELDNIRYYETILERDGNQYYISFNDLSFGITDLSILLNDQQTVDLITHSICNYETGVTRH